MKRVDVEKMDEYYYIKKPARVIIKNLGQLLLVPQLNGCQKASAYGKNMEV